MKSFVLAAVLCSAFAVTFGAVKRSIIEQEQTYLTEAEASKYCNNLYTVTEDPRQKITRIVINGDTIGDPSTFNDIEWCHLSCLLDKVGFYAPDGNMRVKSISKHILNILPELEPNSPNLIMLLYHANRATKDMQDKCSRAYVAYYKFTEAIMISTLAVDLDDNPDIKEKAIEAVMNGTPLPKELNNSIQKSFRNVELFFKKTVESKPGSPAHMRTCAM